jgi:hypothetical protein
MIRWFRRWLRDWLISVDSIETPKGIRMSTSEDSSDCTISIKDAMNGKVLEMSYKLSNVRGHEWKTVCYVLKEGDNIPEAVTLLLVHRKLSTT